MISRDIARAFDSIQHSLLIKTLSKLKIEENFLKLIKGIYENIIFNIILSFSI